MCIDLFIIYIIAVSVIPFDPMLKALVTCNKSRLIPRFLNEIETFQIKLSQCIIPII